MRIVNNASLKDVLQPGKVPDCLTAADIAGLTDPDERNILKVLSDLQLPAPEGCEFVVTLAWCTGKRTAATDDGSRPIIISSFWARFWFVTSCSDPTGRNAVCVADPGWSTLEGHLLAQEGGEAALVEFIFATIKSGVPEQRESIELSAKAHQATAEYEKQLALLLGEIGRDVCIAA